jgi:site-specific recombinase XerD
METDRPILQLIDEFLQDHQATKPTKLKYREHLSVFVRYLTIKSVDPHNIKLSDVTTYKEWLVESGRSSATIMIYMIVVRQFFRYLADLEIYPNIIAERIKISGREDTFKRKHLRPEQVTKLLISINRNSIIGLRDYAIINLMVRTGIRCCEVCRLDMEDFKLDPDHWVMSVQRKGMTEKNDRQGISVKVINPITEYFNERDQDNNVPAFCNHGYANKNADHRMDPKTISRIVKQRLIEAGIDDPLITAHSLRHTAAMTAINQGTDIYQVKAMMCHKDIRTTMIYVRAAEEELKLKGIANQNIDKVY